MDQRFIQKTQTNLEEVKIKKIHIPNELTKSFDRTAKIKSKDFLSDSKVTNTNDLRNSIQIHPFSTVKNGNQENSLRSSSIYEKQNQKARSSIYLHENLKKVLETPPAVNISANIKIHLEEENKQKHDFHDLKQDTKNNCTLSSPLIIKHKGDEYDFAKSFGEPFYVKKENPMYKNITRKKGNFVNNSLQIKTEDPTIQSFNFLSPMNHRGIVYQSPNQRRGFSKSFSKKEKYEVTNSNKKKETKSPLQKIYNEKNEQLEIPQNTIQIYSGSKSPRQQRNTSSIPLKTPKSIVSNILSSSKNNHITRMDRGSRAHSTRFNRNSVAVS